MIEKPRPINTRVSFRSRPSLQWNYLFIFSTMQMYRKVPPAIALQIPFTVSLYPLRYMPRITADPFNREWKVANLMAVDLGIPEAEQENPSVRASAHLWKTIALANVQATASLSQIPIDMHQKKEWVLRASWVRYVYRISLLLIFILLLVRTSAIVPFLLLLGASLPQCPSCIYTSRPRTRRKVVMEIRDPYGREWW